MKLLIGTANKAKQEDFRRSLTYLSKLSGITLDIVFPQDVGITDDIEETEETFAENSELKARWYFEESGIPTISDDGGIIIPILNNEPGVKTRRWLGYESSDEELIKYCLKRLEAYSDKRDRAAFFAVCISYYDGATLLQEEGRIEGYIAQRAHPGNHPPGFPFRALFILDNGKYYDYLAEEEHQKHNHRDIAMKRLLKRIIRLK